MVQVSIYVRPKQGYHYPCKIDLLQIDSSERLESIQEKYTTTGSTTRLYYGKHELPLNSSIGSHNLVDYTVLECCRSPEMSAALSACLKDMDKIKKIPARDRTRERLMGILQTPEDVRYDPDHDIWQSWSDDKLKTRIINLATIKAVLQRQDRYHIHDLPRCDDCKSLFKALEDHNVWKGGGRDQSKRNFLKQQSHIFKPKKKDGNPSTNFLLVQEKLNIQQRIQREFLDGLSLHAGYDSPPEDWLEEFVRQDHARHGNSNSRSGSQQSNSGVDNSADSHLGYLAPSPPRRQNTPTRSRSYNDNGGRETEASTPRTTSPSTRSPSRHYTPQYASGPFAVLATLHLAMHSRHKHLNGRRLLTLSEDQLKRMAQPICRSNLYDKGRIRGRNAFACMDGLIEKQYVRKEIVRNTDIDDGEIEKWGLLREGEVLGEACAEFDRAVANVIPVKEINEINPGKSNMNLSLCLDTREDDHFLKRMKNSCTDENITFVEKELPAGDYLFLEQRSDQEYVMPIVIERKTWSDLADSCLGKGRALNRLDCVKLGSSSESECSGSCQLCKMKRCGCTQIMFIIEGERCLGSDNSHRTAKKCTPENCCSVCRQLKERHDLTQDVLEGVLHRLQIDHGCYIVYTRCYNETIQSLFDMKSLLQMEPNSLFGEPQTYESYASSARRRSIINENPLRVKPTAVLEVHIEAMLALVASDEWDIVSVKQLLGMDTLEQAKQNRHYKRNKTTASCSSPSKRRLQSKTSNHTLSIHNDDEVIELKGSNDMDSPICIDLESARGDGSIRDASSRSNRCTKTICLDSDGEIESDGANNIRGGGHVSTSNTVDLIRGGGNPSSNDKIELLDGSSGSESDDSDGLFSNLSRFDADRRRKLQERSFYHSDDSGDSDIDIMEMNRNHRKQKMSNRKKKGKPRKSPAKSRPSPKKSSTSLKKGRAESSGVARNLSHEICLLSSEDELSKEQLSIATKTPTSSAPAQKTAVEVDVEVLSLDRPHPMTASSRKRKASETDPCEGNELHNNKLVFPLIVLHGWREYDQQFYTRLDRTWKEIYSKAKDSRQMNDLYSTSVPRLNDMLKESTFPLVRRRTLMRFVLWMQLTLGVQIRSVQRTRFAEEIKRCLGQSEKVSAERSLTKSPAISGAPVRHLTPAVSDTNLQKSASRDEVSQSLNSIRSIERRRPPSTNRESDLVREARLRKFDKPSHQPISSMDCHNSGTGWTCPCCTLENSLTDGTCSACGNLSPMKQPPLASKGECWSCSSCTFKNNANDINCSICSASKMSASAMSPICSRSSSSLPDHHSSSQAPPRTSKATPNNKRCGACGREGHNRATATEHNCDAYFDQKEIDRREKIRRKREETIAEEREKIKAIEQESENADKMQAELARQIEELQRNKERAEDFRKEELKRRKQKLQRLQKRQNGND